MIDYRILSEHNLFVVCNWGLPCMADVQNMRQAYRTDPDFSLEYDAFVDMSRLERDYPVEDMQKLGNRFGIHIESVKIAVFAPKDSTFGMVRMFELLTELERQSAIRVFRNILDALKWLGREGVDIMKVCEDIMSGGRFGQK